MQRPAETKRYGSGKVIIELNRDILRLLIGFFVAVKPDADFECMAVMMEHSQDVKCVSWHPTEEVIFVLAECLLEIDSSFEDRFLHRRPTTIRSGFTLTMIPKIGLPLQHCQVTQEQSGQLHGHPAATTSLLPRMTSRSEFGDALLNTHGNLPVNSRVIQEAYTR